MAFIYLSLAAVPRLTEFPPHAAEISTHSIDDLLPSSFQFRTRDAPDAAAKSRGPVFGHSGAVICGVILSALVGLAILRCLIAHRRTLCYKRRGMRVRRWKNLCKKKTNDKERAELDPDPGPDPEAAPLVQHQRGFFSICMGSQMQDQRITTDNHPVRIITVAAPSIARSLPKSLPTASSLLSSSTQGSTTKTTKITLLPTAVTVPSRGLPRPLRPLIRPSALWSPPAPGYSTYPSSKRRYTLNTDEATRVITATRPRRPSPHTIIPTTVVVQESSKSVLSSDSRWIGRLFRERRASEDGTHISNYFSQKSSNPHTAPSERHHGLVVGVPEKMGCSGQGGSSGCGSDGTAAATTPQETTADLTRRIRRTGCRHKVMRAREITKSTATIEATIPSSQKKVGKPNNLIASGGADTDTVGVPRREPHGTRKMRSEWSTEAARVQTRTTLRSPAAAYFSHHCNYSTR